MTPDAHFSDRDPHREAARGVWGVRRVAVPATDRPHNTPTRTIAWPLSRHSRCGSMVDEAFGDHHAVWQRWLCSLLCSWERVPIHITKSAVGSSALLLSLRAMAPPS